MDHTETGTDWGDGTGDFGQTVVTQMQTTGGSRNPRVRPAQEGNSKEEKEFMDQSTKKNLMNVKSKLDRAMSDLSQQIMPVLVLNGNKAPGLPPMVSASHTGSSALGAGDASPTTAMDLLAAAGQEGRHSSKHRNSFGSADASSIAQSLVNKTQTMGSTGGHDKVFSNLGMEVLLRKEQKAQHPLVARNLRELVMVDDRIDSEELHEKLFRSGGAIDWAARAQQDRSRREENARAAEAARLKATQEDDEDDVSLSPVPQQSPRMRHIRSYRCSSQKELMEWRMDMRKEKGGPSSFFASSDTLGALTK